MSEFDRNVWCLLGLPFDAIDMQQTVRSIQQSVVQKKPCFLSTPNLNYLIASQFDSDFRLSVINSQISIADGMPVIWIARLLGVPLPGRVAGSGLIEMLRRSDSNTTGKVSVFFFGGEEGVAKKACQVVNDEQGGLSCAGFYSPGFGLVGDMSDPAVLETINDSKADFIIISLGAKKGQAWIEQNRQELSAPVISHLGAVVNFVAGNVQRAPAWMQKTGLEWVWRILEEPKLWRRYFMDGVNFLLLFMECVLPYAYWRFTNKDMLSTAQPVSYDVKPSDDIIIISIHGNCVAQSITPLREIFCLESEKSLSIRLDLSNVDIIDGAFLGLSLVLSKQLNRNGFHLQFSGINIVVRRIFRWNRVEYLL